MNKKKYIQPACEMIDIDGSYIICTSENTTDLYNGLQDDDEEGQDVDLPEVGQYGVIWGD